MDFSRDAKRAFHVQAYGSSPVIEGVTLVPLTRHTDDGGSLTELTRLTQELSQRIETLTAEVHSKLCV